MKIDSISGSSNLILPGDRVDVMVFRQPAGNDPHATAATIVLQDVKVFAIDTTTENEFTHNKGDQAEAMTAKTISLLVDPQQALILHAASEIGGVVRLALRNPEDDAYVWTRGATIGDIFNPMAGSDRVKDPKVGESEDTKEAMAWLNQSKEKAAPVVPPQEPAGPTTVLSFDARQKNGGDAWLAGEGH